MVRINLLPYREKRQKAQLLRYLFFFLSTLVAASLVVSFLWLRQNRILEERQAEIAAVQAELDNLKQVVEETRKYEERLEALAKRVEVISQLEKNQQGPVRILDEISRQLSEHTWLTSLAEQDFQITLQGYSLSNEGIAGFMKNLQRSRRFGNVELVQSRQEVYAGTQEKVLNFTITLKASLEDTGEIDGGER